MKVAKWLYRLGSWAARKRVSVLVGGILILLLTAVLAISVGPEFTGSTSIPGTKSEKAMLVLNKEFPTPEGVVKGGEIKVIFRAPDDLTLEDESVKGHISDTLDNIRKDNAIASIQTPYENGSLTPDKKIGYANVIYKMVDEDVSEESKDRILAIAEETTEDGLQTELGGTVEFTEIKAGGTSEALGILMAFVILAITFASFQAAGLPILTSIMGLAIGLLSILIGTKFFDMQDSSISLSSMISLAVGIDYALFIISRYRQQLAKGNSVPEAIAMANATAGSAVVFAALTVSIALLGLSVLNIPFLAMMGYTASFCVFIALLIAIIFVPAMLGFMGERIHPSRKNGLLGLFTDTKKKKKQGNAWGRFVVKYPIPVALTASLLLGVIAIPFSHMNLGLPDDGTKSKETPERRSYDLLAEAYGPGFHAPLLIIAEAQGQQDPQASIANAVKKLNGLDNVVTMTAVTPSPSGNAGMLTIIPKTGPTDTETRDLVKEIRDKAETILEKDHVNLMVTGTTAVDIDVSQKLNDALPVFASVIVGLAFILMMLVFRSILVPVKAVLGFLLSISATLGFVVFVIQDGHFIDLFGFPEAGPVMNFLPVFLIGILFGLAMDYEVFLVSRMREEYIHYGDAKKAVVEGMNDSGTVVTAAGLIMISVFAGFILAEEPIIKSMGIALAFGVLFDAFVVRMTIVPAVMSLLGKSAWYLPKWLDRILPNIDIEGEALAKELEQAKAAESNMETKNEVTEAPYSSQLQTDRM